MRNSNSATVIATVPSSACAGTGSKRDQPGRVQGADVEVAAEHPQQDEQREQYEHDALLVAHQAAQLAVFAAEDLRLSGETSRSRRGTSSPIRPRRPTGRPTDSGSANTNHSAKVISGAAGKTISRIRAKARLGGVPINVARPPIEARVGNADQQAHARSVIRVSRRSVSLNWLTMAIAIGTTIIVAAVFEIHIDRNHVAAMKPSATRRGLVPSKQDRLQRDAAVQVPLLHRQREDEPADEQENDVVEVHSRPRRHRA